MCVNTPVLNTYVYVSVLEKHTIEREREEGRFFIENGLLTRDNNNEMKFCHLRKRRNS